MKRPSSSCSAGCCGHPHVDALWRACTPLVKAGDHVKVGQKIGEFHGLGAPIHASVSGTVKAVEPRPYSMGGNITSVVIENDMQDEVSEEVQVPADPNALSVEEMVEIVKNAGIVGMGGATFPTHVKITSGIGKVNTVIINGAECEPTSRATTAPCWSGPRRSLAAPSSWPRCSAWTRSSSAWRTTRKTASRPQQGHRRAEGSCRGRIAALPLPAGR